MRQLIVLHIEQLLVLAFASIAGYTLRDLHQWLTYK